jgi:hypothetical protein
MLWMIRGKWRTSNYLWEIGRKFHSFSSEDKKKKKKVRKRTSNLS